MRSVMKATAILAAGLTLLAALPLEAGQARQGRGRSVDPVMGEYTGTFKPAQGAEVEATAKVIAMGVEKEGKKPYRVVVTTEGEKPVKVQLDGDFDGTQLALSGKGWEGKLAERALTLKGEGGEFTLERTYRRSPTQRKAPPEGAIVLLPYERGTPVDEAVYNKNWTNPAWLLKADEEVSRRNVGSMQVRKGSNFTKQKFGDCRLHLEFKCPYEPEKRGQGRGNSGVYLQGRYEVQVLDSFGLEPGMGDCGSIYGVAITKHNASLPPEQWQTYDIVFCAPRFDAAGKMTERPWITVYHNGIKIHDKQEITKDFTTAAPRNDKGAPEDSLYLQDHGNAVNYRNIWLLEGVGDGTMDVSSE